jgi:type IV pilus assembly protein PilW
MQMTLTNPHKGMSLKGMSLIELLIAITIMSLISLAVTTMYVNTSQNYGQDERVARMQENGRFALNMMAQDISMADFWGEFLDPGGIDPTAVTAGTDDCNTGILNLEDALLYYKNGAATPMFDPSGCTVLTTTSPATNFKTDTSALAIKRVANQPESSPVNGIVYVRTNGTLAELVADAASTAAPADYNDWEYQPRLYYIREDADDVPYLCRTDIKPGTTVEFQQVDEDDCLAEGIEQLHVEFGLDTDGDLVPNQYKSDITAAEAEDAVTVRIYLLARSASAETNYSNTKKYYLGSLGEITPGDNYYRRVFSTTVALRNPLAYVGLSQ